MNFRLGDDSPQRLELNTAPVDFRAEDPVPGERITIRADLSRSFHAGDEVDGRCLECRHPALRIFGR